MNHFTPRISIFVFFLIFFLFLVNIPGFSDQNKDGIVEPLSPSNGVTLFTDIPALVWAGDNADTYEVWIDGVCMAKVGGDKHRVIPFPLFYGQHIWYVDAG